MRGLPHPTRLLADKNVLSGLLFMAVAALGLWLSRDYPVGTALRMGTGYMPRLLCWLLLGLGAVVALQGVRRPAAAGAVAWQPLSAVTAGLVLFALAIERLGLVTAILLLVGAGALASRSLRPAEIAAAALVLIVLCWAIFILGLGLTIPVWPEW